MTAEWQPDPVAARQRAMTNLTFEIVPIRSAKAAVEALPPASTVSVTCSPTTGIATTRELTDRIRAHGHVVIPHLAARMVGSRAEVDELARWLRTEAIPAVFVIAGDAEVPAGAYSSGAEFLRDLLHAGPDLTTVGVPGYPDGHPFISTEAIDLALRAKQSLLDQAGTKGWVSTQMCFDHDRISAWARRERAAGLHLPIHLGVPGVVERAKLMSMGMRLGVGASMRYLRKNRKAVGRLLMQPDYDPDDLLMPLAPELGPLGITGIHCFTFNQVEATAAWRHGALG